MWLKKYHQLELNGLKKVIRSCSTSLESSLSPDLQDHRTLGQQQKLFMFHAYSPGNVFFLPHGQKVCQTLIDFLRKEYKKEGYQEVGTPIVYHSDLWKQSGHWEKYKDDMYLLENEHEETNYGLKPMNCPAHCLIYNHTRRSFRQLPLRIADFGMLHRNEISGALNGLTRLRKFQQDDAHIFCTRDQLADEAFKCLNFIDKIYRLFGFEYSLSLSTRPKDNYLGELDVWNKAENALKVILDRFGREWDIKDGDGAFYGPKIDLTLTDYMGRKHQTATIQLDFQLPVRFELEYQGEDGYNHQPVMIHRAILGSIERMFAILLEHYQGKWPFWLSPRQAMICTVSDRIDDYAKQIHHELSEQGYHVEMDLSNNTLNKKIRDAQLMQFNYILVLGEKEKNAEIISIRSRDGNFQGSKTIQALMDLFTSLLLTYK